jgi:haloacetate dehalogenase
VHISDEIAAAPSATGNESTDGKIASMTDFFPGFEQRQVQTSGATINLVTGGSGPPLLLLHGYPQTHTMWRKVAPRLAEHFTVVVPDLRGYGDSSKPPAGDDVINYSKRALALDQVETMAALGHQRFAVAGHDRGARVTHRLLRDHAGKITRAATLDIVPTLYRFETIDQKAATGSWHWFFLIQGRGLPEHMIGGDPEFFLRHMFGTLLRDQGAIEPEAFAEYLRCFKNPETIRATCDEYRAGASMDLVHDRADLAQKVKVPMLILWGTSSGQGSGYDLLKVWRDHAEDVRGFGIDSGHFIPEEKPDEVCKALTEFFS